MWKSLLFSVVGLSLLVSPALGAKGDKKVQKGEVATEVTTKPTDPITGERHSADSDWTTITVPKGYVIIKDRTQRHPHVEFGSENWCNVEYDDYVEILPNIEMPRTIKVSCHARSGKGRNKRGHSKYIVEYTYTKYK